MKRRDFVQGATLGTLAVGMGVPALIAADHSVDLGGEVDFWQRVAEARNEVQARVTQRSQENPELYGQGHWTPSWRQAGDWTRVDKTTNTSVTIDLTARPGWERETHYLVEVLQDKSEGFTKGVMLGRGHALPTGGVALGSTTIIPGTAVESNMLAWGCAAIPRDEYSHLVISLYGRQAPSYWIWIGAEYKTPVLG